MEKMLLENCYWVEALGYVFAQQDEPNNCFVAGKEKACTLSLCLDTHACCLACTSHAVVW